MQPGEHFGMRLACVPDLDGDGDAEVIVTAPDHNGAAGEAAGRVALHRGGPSGLETAPAWELHGSVSNGHLGQDVAVAGDVNGDGHIDLLLASGLLEPQAMEPGRAWWVRGVAGGFEGTPAWDSGEPRAFGLPGRHLTPLGDLDADGFADFAVGAALWTEGTGRFDVWHGSETGPKKSPGLTGSAPSEMYAVGLYAVGPGALMVAAPRGGGLHLVRRNAEGVWATTATFAATPEDALGFAADIGEIDGDPQPEVLVGGFWYKEGAGQALVLEVQSDALTRDSWSGEGGASSTSYGWSTLLHDLDGDGLDEVIVGSDGWDGALGSLGRVEVFRGRAGLKAGDPPDWSAVGVEKEARLGSALDACDVDGDGTDELIVGADGVGEGRLGGVAVYRLGK